MWASSLAAASPPPPTVSADFRQIFKKTLISHMTVTLASPPLISDAGMCLTTAMYNRLRSSNVCVIPMPAKEPSAFVDLGRMGWNRYLACSSQLRTLRLHG